MKTPRISSRLLLTMAFVFAAASFATPLFADDTDDAATIDVLCAGDWRVSGKGWYDFYTFTRDHTVVRHLHPPKEKLTWKINDNKVIIQYADHEQLLYLPLDPKGTKGFIPKGGYPFIAVRSDSIPGNNNPQPAQAGVPGTGGGNAAFGYTSPSSPASNSTPSSQATPPPFGQQQPQ